MNEHDRERNNCINYFGKDDVKKYVLQTYGIGKDLEGRCREKAVRKDVVGKSKPGYFLHEQGLHIHKPCGLLAN